MGSTPNNGGIFGKWKKISQAFAMRQLVQILPFVSKKNLVKVIGLYEKIAKGENKNTVKALKGMLDGNAGDTILRGVKILNPKARAGMATKLLADGLIMRGEKRKAIMDQGGCVPSTVLISPTMRCNLRCTGCYAYNYDKNDDLPYEVVDRVVTEAEEMGVAFITILGGEPLMWEHLFELFEKHPNMYFQFYSNSTLITKEVVDRIAKLGNVAVMLSIEGFEKETDDRRGEGTYKKISAAMDLLREAGVVFGFSAAITSINEPVIASDEFIDLMVEKGAIIGWFFLYMPVGKDPDLSLMPSPEQRAHLLEFDKRVRKEKPIFIVDFWNDAPFVGGCIAGKQYIHITSTGDVEPCIFTHLAQDNIKDKSLREVMESEFFKKLRAKQPYNDNHYMPCMWIDNPEISREFHRDMDLKLTHPGADDILKRPDLVEGMNKYSARVKEIYDKKWQEDFGGKPIVNAGGPCACEDKACGCCGPEADDSKQSNA